MLNTATTPQTKVTPKPILLNNPQKPLPIIFNETRFAYVDEMFVLSAGIFDACYANLIFKSIHQIEKSLFFVCGIKRNGDDEILFAVKKDESAPLKLWIEQCTGEML